MAYNQAENTQSTVNETLFRGVIEMLKRQSSWEGTMTDLNRVLVKRVGKQVKSVWPGSPSALRVSFNRVVNRLRNAGVSVRFVRSEHRLVKLIMQ